MATFEFVNLPTIDSVDQVHELFGEFIQQKIKPGEEQAFRNDQIKLRGWLEQLLRKDGRLGTKLTKQVQAQLGRTAFAQVALENGRIGVTRFLLPGVESCLAFAAALLIDRNRRLTPFLRRCAAPRCGRFFLAERCRGRPCSWCSARHKEMAQAALNVKRVRRWQEKCE